MVLSKPGSSKVVQVESTVYAHFSQSKFDTGWCLVVLKPRPGLSLHSLTGAESGRECKRVPERIKREVAAPRDEPANRGHPNRQLGPGGDYALSATWQSGVILTSINEGSEVYPDDTWQSIA